jgi:hypothetical protein
MPSLPNDEFAGVSCRSSGDCIAVGDATDVVLTGYWNGTNWTIATPENGFGTGFLTGVSCPTRNACFAVGTGGDEGVDPILMDWNGMSWSDSSFARDYDPPVAISCSSATGCTAIGNDGTTNRWNGRRWKLEPLSGNAFLEAVSCVSRGVCVAVGQTDVDAAFVIRRS